MAYIGTTPIDVRSFGTVKFEFTATSGQTAFTGTDDNNKTLSFVDDQLEVYVNGVLMDSDDFSTSGGNTVTLASAAAANDIITVNTLKSNAPITDYVQTTGGTFTGAITVDGTVTADGLTVAGNVSADGGTIKLDGNYPTGTGNVALGDAAFDSVTSGAANVAIGASALTANTSGTGNTGVGYNSLITHSTGNFNTAVGNQSLYNNTTASNNTAVGYQALYDNVTGTSLVAVGYQALANNIGNSNTAVGLSALFANTTGTENTGLGTGALYANTTGEHNSAVGYGALDSNTTGTSNTAVGYNALTANQTSNSLTAVGKSAGATTTQAAGTYVGAFAGQNTNSVSNTFVGANAGQSITSGGKNTIVGRYNGNQDTWDIRTSSNNIVLSDGDGFPRMIINSSGQNYNTASVSSYWAFAVENNHGGSCGTYRSRTSSSADNTSSYHFVAWAGADRMYIYGNGNVVNTNNSYGALSDQKLKENIVDSGSQWDDVKALRVRKYSLIEEAAEAPTKLGVIAQEVEASGMGGLVFESPDRDDDGNVLETSTKQVNYSVLYMKAVKALQEAMERIETLEAENTAIKARLDALEAN